MSRATRPILLAVGVLAVLFVAFIWWRADQGRLPAAVKALYDFPHGDKVGHFVLMGLLTLFVCLPFCRGEPRRARKRVLVLMAVIAAVITLEEWSQGLFASRSMELADLLCSYAGIAVFGGAILWWRRG